MHKQFWWQHDFFICGFEEGDPPEDDAADDAADDTDDEEDDSSSGGTGDKKSDDDLDGLKSALAKERADNKKTARLLKQLQKAEQERKDADLSEGAKSTKRAETAEARVNALAAALKTNVVNGAIVSAARDMKFRDPQDALKYISEDELGVEQDEDNPEKVTFDQAALESALKKLTKKKQYLLKADDDDEENDDTPSSGSRFNGRRRNKAALDEEALKKKYPALGP